MSEEIQDIQKRLRAARWRNTIFGVCLAGVGVVWLATVAFLVWVATIGVVS